LDAFWAIVAIRTLIHVLLMSIDAKSPTLGPVRKRTLEHAKVGNQILPLKALVASGRRTTMSLTRSASAACCMVIHSGAKFAISPSACEISFSETSAPPEFANSRHAAWPHNAA
jgi:hypothetical protein